MSLYPFKHSADYVVGADGNGDYETVKEGGSVPYGLKEYKNGGYVGAITDNTPIPIIA